MVNPRPATPQSILVADDDEDMCSFLRAALEGAGYEVRTASDGAQVLTLQRERYADLLITDVFMKGQEGIETSWRFKAAFPNTKIMVISAGGERGQTQDVLSTAALLGVDATLRKPFSAEQILDAVRRVLQPP